MPTLVDNFDLLWGSIEEKRCQHPFNLLAWVVLPDHMHILIDPLKNDLPNLMKRIKQSFSAKYRIQSRQKSGRIWQFRYWDHMIRNEKDLNRYFDYIHYNAVKHGLVDAPMDYSYSSFRDYAMQGYYDENWGIKTETDSNGQFGE